MKGSLLGLVFPIQNLHLPAVIYHDENFSTTVSYGDLSEYIQQVSKALNPLCDENSVVAIATKQLHYLVPSLILG